MSRVLGAGAISAIADSKSDKNDYRLNAFLWRSSVLPSPNLGLPMTDRYSKIVLTVIAISLSCIVAQNAITSLNAQVDRPQRVVICDARDNNRCAALGKWGEPSSGFGYYYLMVSEGAKQP
jgi:hypothetical protein